MRAVDKVDIHLDVNEARVVSHFSDGMKASKIVAADDLCSALVQNAKFSTGILPRNTKMIVRSGDQTTVVIEDPPRMGHIVHYMADGDRNRMSFKINTPRSLFVFKVQTNNPKAMYVTQSLIYALENPLMSDRDKIFRYPLSNTNEGGSICWGDYRAPQFTSLVFLETLPDVFYSLNFNNHLDHGGGYIPVTKTTAEGQKIKLTHTVHLFQHLDGDPNPFPTNILIPYGEFSVALRRELGV